MICQRCRSHQIKCLETRHAGEYTYRKRRCVNCGRVFYTRETELQTNGRYEFASALPRRTKKP